MVDEEKKKKLDIEKPHSIEIKTTSKGEVSFTVKAYGATAEEAETTVKQLYDWCLKTLPSKVDLKGETMKARGDDAEEIIAKPKGKLGNVL